MTDADVAAVAQELAAALGATWQRLARARGRGGALRRPSSCITMGQERLMGTPKEEVRRLLDRLPEDASLEDIQYHIYVQEKIERALEDVREGRVLDEQEVERRMAKWLGE